MSRSAEGKVADCEASRTQGDDRSPLKLGCDERQVRDQKRCVLVWGELGDVPEMHDRGAGRASDVEQHGEVAVSRNDNKTVDCSAVEDRGVGGGGQPEVGDVNDRVPGDGEKLDEAW